MKILFLDVDGVLNHRQSISLYAISRPALRRLRHVLDSTGARVVMSSTWRKNPDHREVFKRRTLIQPIGYTPCHADGHRGGEIKAWLDQAPEVERYAIVDDDGDMLIEQRPFFVQTSFETGLLDEHVDQLIEILGRQP